MMTRQPWSPLVPMAILLTGWLNDNLVPRVFTSYSIVPVFMLYDSWGKWLLCGAAGWLTLALRDTHYLPRQRWLSLWWTMVGLLAFEVIARLFGCFNWMTSSLRYWLYDHCTQCNPDEKWGAAFLWAERPLVGFGSGCALYSLWTLVARKLLSKR